MSSICIQDMHILLVEGTSGDKGPVACSLTPEL